MQLPVDIKAVIDEATNIDEARRTTLSVSVYLDDSAPGDAVQRTCAKRSPAHRRTPRVAHVPRRPPVRAVLGRRHGRHRGGFERAGGGVRGAGSRGGRPRDGGHHAARSCGRHRERRARPSRRATSSSASPQGRAPAVPAPDAAAGGARPCRPGRRVRRTSRLDGAAVGSLSERIWLRIAACNDKRLAFALAFPFVRKPLSLGRELRTALQNAGVGLLVIIPSNT